MKQLISGLSRVVFVVARRVIVPADDSLPNPRSASPSVTEGSSPPSVMADAAVQGPGVGAWGRLVRVLELELGLGLGSPCSRRRWNYPASRDDVEGGAADVR